MTPEGIGGGFGEPPKDVGGKENFSVPEDVGRQDDKEVVNSGVESGEKSEEVLVGDKTEALAGEAPTSSKEGDLEPAKDGTVGIEKEVSSEEETEVLTGEVFTPGKDGSLEPVSKNGSVIDFSKKEPVVKEEGESAPKHGDVVFEDKEEYPEDTEEKPESVLINEIKEAVKAYHILDMDEGEDRNEAAKQVLKVAKISGVGDLENLLAARNNKNVSQEGISRKVDQLGIAISKAIEEVGSPEMKQAIEAGSFSTEKILPEAWKIVVEGDERDQSLARVIVDGAIESKVSNAARRDAISNEMESVDYYLNNPQYGLLEGQIEASIASLRAMQSPLRAKEMSFISGKIAYLQELKTNIGGKNIKDRDTIESEVVTEASAESHESKKGKSERTRKSEDVPEEAFRGRKDKEEGEESKREGATRSWELDASHMADAFKFMAGDLRWSDWTPPEWFKDLEKSKSAEAYRISVMVMVNEAAAGVAYAGKNLDKIIGNDGIFAFTNEHMSKLFDDNFKLVVSKMLNDLCELYPDQNGRQCLRYKEGWDEKKKVWTIKDDVLSKISHIKEYEEDLAKFLAEVNGREEPDYMDRMNAYTAWNMFYGFGDSSVADRMRILPTYNNVINDAIRTLNPEYKALSKWQILKSGFTKEDKDLFDSEYFSGPLADYVLTVMKIERDLGHEEDRDGKKVWISKPIDGVKTLRQKILDGDMPLLAKKTFYGFFDFVNGGRDLCKGDFISAETQLKDGVEPEKFYNKKTDEGEKVTLSSLLMDYGFYKEDDSGKKVFVRKETSGKFNFGNSQVTFMNEFRDMLEGAILVYTCVTGKVEVKDPAVWARNLKDKFGMINGIEINGSKALSYTSDPNLWRDAIIGSFGADMERLSSDYVRIKVEVPKGSTAAPAYNLYVNNFLTEVLRLSGKDINLNELMRKLGVSLGKGESPETIRASVRNKVEWKNDKERTEKLLKMQSDVNDRDLSKRFDDEIKDIISNFKLIDRNGLDRQSDLIYRNLEMAIQSGNIDVIKRLWKEISDKG